MCACSPLSEYHLSSLDGLYFPAIDILDVQTLLGHFVLFRHFVGISGVPTVRPKFSMGCVLID